jgi:lipopolysaccharide transport system permease protein
MRKEPTPYHPLAFLMTGWRHRHLIRRLAWRAIEARYRGSVLGLLWAFVQPLMMLAVYTFVFSVVFESRWDLPESDHSHFALFLFSGLILFSVFADCVNQAPRLVRANRVFITQIRFPVEALCWVSLCEALVQLAFAASILAAGYVAVIGAPPLSWIFLPAVLLPLALFTLGASWLLASLGVYLEDISQIVSVFTTALLFLSPIFYSSARIPEAFRTFYFLNPLAYLLEMSKQPLFLGIAPDWMLLGLLMLLGWLVAWAGHLWFVRSKAGFADVL